MQLFRKLSVVLSIHSLIYSLPLCAQEASSQIGNNSQSRKSSKLNIKEIVLPSEVKGIRPAPGAYYYSPSVKDKVLIPVNFWGQVQKPGLHFVPVNTNLVSGLSLAGGPTTEGVLDSVSVTRKLEGQLVKKEFDLEAGGDEESYAEILQPNDTVFIERSSFLADRQYYTSLIGVIATFLSTILLYREVKKN